MLVGCAAETTPGEAPGDLGPAPVATVIQGLAGEDYARTVPRDPSGNIDAWDWTSSTAYGDAVSRYVSPWSGSSSSGVLPVGETCPKTDGWELYHRRLFVGDENLLDGVLNPGTRYFMLYNRFSGVLRLFFYDGQRRLDYNTAFASVQVEDRQRSATLAAQGDLFNHMESDTAGPISAAWNSTKVLTALSSGSASVSNPWLVFDFRPDFDPFNRGPRFFHVRVFGKQSTSFDFSGELTGALTSTSTSPDWSSFGGVFGNGLSALGSVAVAAGGAHVGSIGAKALGGYLTRNSTFAPITALGGILTRNEAKGTIGKLLEDKALPAGFGFLVHDVLGLNAPTKVSQSVSTLDARITLKGEGTQNNVIGDLTVGVADLGMQLEPASTLEVPYLARRKTLPGLGVIGIKRPPRVWALARTQTNPPPAYGTSTYVGAEYHVENAVAADLIQLNPYAGSSMKVVNVSYAVRQAGGATPFSKTTWTGSRATYTGATARPVSVVVSVLVTVEDASGHGKDMAWSFRTTAEPVADAKELQRMRDEFVPNVYRMPRLSFSSRGPIEGMRCISVNEPSDPHGWSNNYLCSSTNETLRWSNAGPISGMDCTAITEAADPHGWNNNYLCRTFASPVRFTWSSAGPVAGKECVRFHEPEDPYTWADNYLCLEEETKVRVGKHITGDQSYTVYADVDDALGATGVVFPSWTANNGQDDLQWVEGTRYAPGKWKATIWIDQHNGELGQYLTHVYARKSTGETFWVGQSNPIIKSYSGGYPHQIRWSQNLRDLKTGDPVVLATRYAGQLYYAQFTEGSPYVSMVPQAFPGAEPSDSGESRLRVTRVGDRVMFERIQRGVGAYLAREADSGSYSAMATKLIGETNPRNHLWRVDDPILRGQLKPSGFTFQADSYAGSLPTTAPIMMSYLPDALDIYGHNAWPDRSSIMSLLTDDGATLPIQTATWRSFQGDNINCQKPRCTNEDELGLYWRVGVLQY
jgi:hypothetical protein